MTTDPINAVRSDESPIEVVEVVYQRIDAEKLAGKIYRPRSAGQRSGRLPRQHRNASSQSTRQDIVLGLCGRVVGRVARCATG